MTGRYPRRFGKYVLLKPLAKGGMGEIYLAAGGDIGGFEKLCVIKKVLTEKADRTKANRFLDEAKVVLRLSHAALTTTFDAGQVDGEFYIAMELVEGKDLREVWNRCVRTRQRIPLDVALHVVREVARALAYVHAYGDLKLVHRDVAPPNILLAYVGDVKLTDFGLARSVLKQEHTAPGVVFGRAAYLAPEQARGEVADSRTDIYTLGIVLWELLTGQQYLQLSGLDPVAALAIVRHPKIAPPSSRAPWIPPALDQVVAKALAPERDKRFQTADELRRALADVIVDIAPRADAARVADFLKTIYKETIEEERVERERFLTEEIAKFRTGTDRPDGKAKPEPGVSSAAQHETGRDGGVTSPGAAGSARALTPARTPVITSSSRLAAGRGPSRASEPKSEPGDEKAGESGPRLPGLAPAPASTARPAPGPAVARAVGVDAVSVGPSRFVPRPIPPAARPPGTEAPGARPATTRAAPVSVAPQPTPVASGGPTSSRSATGSSPVVAGPRVETARPARATPAGVPPAPRPPRSTPTEAAEAVPVPVHDAGARVIAGRFRVVRTLFDGATGAIHSVRPPDGDGEATLRMFRQVVFSEGESVERWRRDARAAAAVKHPGLADLLDLGVTEDAAPFALYGPMSGTGLAAHLARERRLDAELAVRIAIGLAQALAAAHAAGLVHGGLRPESVFFSAPAGAPADVKILDFGWAAGLAREMTRRRRTPALGFATLAGSMSPEQFRGDAPDARSDIYSVAAILYEMLTGAPPHAGTADLAARRHQEPPQSPRLFRPELSEDLTRVLLGALERDPGRRPASMAEFGAALSTLVGQVGGIRLDSTGGGIDKDDRNRRRATREAALLAIADLNDDPGPTPLPVLLPGAAPGRAGRTPQAWLPAQPRPAPGLLPPGSAFPTPLPHLSLASASGSRTPGPAIGGAVLSPYGGGGASSESQGWKTAVKAVVLAVILGGAALALSDPWSCAGGPDKRPAPALRK